MEFTFRNYKLFCYDFNLKADRYKNLKIFKEYCNGNYDTILGILYLLELEEFYNDYKCSITTDASYYIDNNCRRFER